MGYKDLKFDKDSVFLVTGGAGFIGSNLCEAILNLGYKVRCLDDLSTGNPKHVEMFEGNPNYTFIKGDIKDLDTCMKACEGVDYVLNQAAWGSVPRSIEMPIFYAQNNIVGTLNMMEAARQNGVKKFVYASSSSVYGDHPGLPKKEVYERHISTRLEELMNQRQSYIARTGGEKVPPIEGLPRYLSVCVPILAAGDMSGAVCLLQPESGAVPGEGDIKLIQVAAAFLGRQMEE